MKKLLSIFILILFVTGCAGTGIKTKRLEFSHKMGADVDIHVINSSKKTYVSVEISSLRGMQMNIENNKIIAFLVREQNARSQMGNSLITRNHMDFNIVVAPSDENRAFKKAILRIERKYFLYLNFLIHIDKESFDIGGTGVLSVISNKELSMSYSPFLHAKSERDIIKLIKR
jgi:hypothetical protein